MADQAGVEMRGFEGQSFSAGGKHKSRRVFRFLARPVAPDHLLPTVMWECPNGGVEDRSSIEFEI